MASNDKAKERRIKQIMGAWFVGAILIELVALASRIKGVETTMWLAVFLVWVIAGVAALRVEGLAWV